MQSILIVDDDADVREIVSFKLGRVGYEVITASDGAAGFEAWTQLRPDLVLVDWVMPKVSGVELCRQIRDSSEYADTPVILLTACTREADIRVGLGAGVDDYIVKPFSPNELASRVEIVLQGRHTRRGNEPIRDLR